MREDLIHGIACAEEISARWERGDLAGAVRALADWAKEAKERHAITEADLAIPKEYLNQ